MMCQANESIPVPGLSGPESGPDPGWDPSVILILLSTWWYTVGEIGVDELKEELITWLPS